MDSLGAGAGEGKRWGDGRKGDEVLREGFSWFPKGERGPGDRVAIGTREFKRLMGVDVIIV